MVTATWNRSAARRKLAGRDPVWELLLDLFLSDAKKWVLTPVASFSLLGAFIPVLTIALNTDGARSLFDGRYVVDEFSLTLKALFLIAGYVVVLMSQNHVEEGDYYQGEVYALLLTSTLGMMIMAGARDLITIFVALETISIPTFVLAGWRKATQRPWVVVVESTYPNSQQPTHETWEPLLRHAGAIFLGAYTSESLGDYCAGPNHVLPTSGTARFSSPLGVYDFQKRSSLIEVSQAGAQSLGRIAAELAYGEGLQGHARAAEMRLK